MQKLKIKKTIQPDFKFQSYTAWMKFICNRNNQKLTLKTK